MELKEQVAVAAGGVAVLGVIVALVFEDPLALEVSDDMFDAVVCSLVGLACAAGMTTLPDLAQIGAASREGWIPLPTNDLGGLGRWAARQS